MAADQIDVKDLSNELLLCRTIGHDWQHNPTPELNTYYPKQWLLALRCSRCMTERFDWTNRGGEVISRYYRYVKQVKLNVKGRTALRAEMIGRSLLMQRVRDDGTV